MNRVDSITLMDKRNKMVCFCGQVEGKAQKLRDINVTYTIEHRMWEGAIVAVRIFNTCSIRQDEVSCCE
jgi:hypothetical protein